MSKNYFDIIRPGINTTFQDKGRDHLYHIGIPFSGAMDNRNFLIANKLVNNHLDTAVIEFAYQGPHIRYSGEKINFAITGDVIFLIKKKHTEIKGNCYQTYQIENRDEINIVSTNKSVYGYIALGGELDIKFHWNSCSINTKANIGPNDGKKLDVGQRINLKKINSNKDIKKIN
ncbi:allophanate hydrolase, partial [Candidatus Pelagibacter sp.]|nr:allophanate hydrolase [Candidatus Pelagibacter sp.]